MSNIFSDALMFTLAYLQIQSVGEWSVNKQHPMSSSLAINRNHWIQIQISNHILRSKIYRSASSTPPTTMATPQGSAPEGAPKHVRVHSHTPPIWQLTSLKGLPFQKLLLRLLPLVPQLQQLVYKRLPGSSAF